MSAADYQPPVAPKILDYDKKNYFCDFCNVNRTIFHDEDKRCTIENHIASFTGLVHLKSHFETKKHLKQMEELEKQKTSGDAILCKECNKYFTKEAYKIHHDRNRMFYLLIDKKGNGFISCNNFVLNNRRFASYSSLVSYKVNYEEYLWRKKTYNKYIRLLREGKGRKKIHDSIKAGIMNKFHELDLKKYNNK